MAAPIQVSMVDIYHAATQLKANQIFQSHQENHEVNYGY